MRGSPPVMAPPWRAAAAAATARSAGDSPRSGDLFFPNGGGSAFLPDDDDGAANGDAPAAINGDAAGGARVPVLRGAASALRRAVTGWGRALSYGSSGSFARKVRRACARVVYENASRQWWCERSQTP